MSNSLYASSIATTYDVGGSSFAAWNENGLAMLARWDSEAQRWNDAQPIGDAGSGRNLRLIGAPLLAGGELPALIASWEQGAGNNSAVHLAIGTYRSDGSLRWSDSVRLGEPGVAASNHQIGVSDKGEILITAETQVRNHETFAAETEAKPQTINNNTNNGSHYIDKEISTYRIIPLKAVAYKEDKRNDATRAIYTGGMLELPWNIDQESALEVQANGVNILSSLIDKKAAEIKIGTVTLGKNNSLRFSAEKKLLSEVVITVVDQDKGSVRRRSFVIQPQGQKPDKDSDYALRIFKDDQASYSSIPLTFSNADRGLRATASTFQAFIPTSQGYSPRELSSGGLFSDEAIAARGDQNQPVQSVPKQDLENSQETRGLTETTDVEDIAGVSVRDSEETNSRGQFWSQLFDSAYPYWLSNPQTNRFEVTFGDVTQAMMGPTFSLRWIGDAISPIFQVGIGGHIGFRKKPDDVAEKNIVQIDSGLYFEVLKETGLAGGVLGNNQGLVNQEFGIGGLMLNGMPYSRGIYNGKDSRFTQSRRSNGWVNDPRLALNSKNASKWPVSKDDTRFDKLTPADRAIFAPPYVDGNGVQKEGSWSRSDNAYRTGWKLNQQSACGLADWGIRGGYFLGVPGLKGLRFGVDAYQQYFQEVDGLSPKQRRWEAYLDFLLGASYRIRFGSVGTSLLPGGAENAGDGNYFVETENSGAHYTQNDTATVLFLNAEAGLEGSIGIGGGRTYTKPKDTLVDSGDLTLSLDPSNLFRRAEVPPPFADKQFWSWMRLLSLSGSLVRGTGNILGGNFNSALGLLPYPTHRYGYGSDYYIGVNDGIVPEADEAQKITEIQAKINRNVSLLQSLNAVGGAMEKFAELPWWSAAVQSIFTTPSNIDKYYQDFKHDVGLRLNVKVFAETSLFNRAVGVYASTGIEGFFGTEASGQWTAEAGWMLAGIRQSFLDVSKQLGNNDLPVRARQPEYSAVQSELAAWPEHTIVMGAKAYQHLEQALNPWERGEELLSSAAGIGATTVEASDGSPLNPVIVTEELNRLVGNHLLVIEGVLTLPSTGETPEDRLQALSNLALNLQSESPARLLIDRRALAPTIDAALADQDPWQVVVETTKEQYGHIQSGWLGESLKARSNQPVPFRIEIIRSGASDTSSADDQELIGISYQSSSVGGGKKAGFSEAQLASEMPSLPKQRNDLGSQYIYGLDVGDLDNSTLIQTEQPYVGGIAVVNGGSGYTSSDFIYAPENGSVVHGKLHADINGAIKWVELLATAESAVFRTKKELDEKELQVRLPDEEGGKDAIIVLRAAENSFNADQQSEIAILNQGSGYLGGRSGFFTQRARLEDNTESIVLEVMVTDGLVTGVTLLESTNKPIGTNQKITLTNSIGGGNGELSLRLITRSAAKNNLVDETHNSLSSSSNWESNTFKSNVIQAYTQHGPDPTKAIGGLTGKGLNLDLPLVTSLYDRPNSGWNSLGAIQADNDGYTPGINGLNYGAAIAPIYVGGSTNKRRQLMIFSHSDLSAIREEEDLYLLPAALQRGKLYYTIYDGAKWLSPLEVPGQALGVNNAAIIEPWRSQQGAAVKPVNQATDEVLVAWVATNDQAETTINVTLGKLETLVRAGKSSEQITWQKPTQISLPTEVESSQVSRLSLTYLNENTPVVSWSLDTKIPYAATVYEDEPVYYYRLDDINSPFLNGGSGTIDATGVVPSSSLSKYSSPFAEEGNLQKNAGVIYNIYGSLERPIAEGNPGDSNAAMQFNGGEFAIAQNPKLDTVISDAANLSNSQPSGYAVEFWTKTDRKDTFSSFVDEGLYQTDSVLPSSDEIRLPIKARRIPATDEQGNKGYVYTLYLPRQSSASLGADGQAERIGQKLSPINLGFINQSKRKRTFRFSENGQETAIDLEIPEFDFSSFTEATLERGGITSLRSRDTDLPISGVFIIDKTSPGEQKEAKAVESSNISMLGITAVQSPGWSIRKKSEDGREWVVYTYGESIDPDTGIKTAHSLEGEINSDEWNHIYAAYNSSGPGSVELYINGQLADSSEDAVNTKAFSQSAAPVAIGYGAKAALDELAFYLKPLSFPAERLQRRLEARYVDPQAASKNTFFSEGVFDQDLKTWNWTEAQHFNYRNVIPPTIPAITQDIGVDSSRLGTLNGIGPDGNRDTHYKVSYTLPQDLKAGSRLRGIRVTLESGDVYALGKGPAELYQSNTGTEGSYRENITGLITAATNGELLNTGEEGSDINSAIMAGRLDLDLYIQPTGDINPNKNRYNIAKAELWIQDPEQIIQGRIGNSLVVDNAPFPALQSGGMQIELGEKANFRQAVKRIDPLSLAEIDTGVNYTLIPIDQAAIQRQLAKSAALSQGEGMKNKMLLSMAFAPTESSESDAKGKIWILPFDQPKQNQQLLAKLSLEGADYKSILAKSPELEALCVIGGSGQPLGYTMAWADLNGDQYNDLIVGDPDAGDGDGRVIVVSGRYIEQLRKNANPFKRVLDLDEVIAKRSSTNEILLFEGDALSGLGRSIGVGNLGGVGLGTDLVIGAPSQVVIDSVGKSQKLGAVKLLKRATDLFGSKTEMLLTTLAEGKLEAVSTEIKPSSPRTSANAPQMFGASLAVIPSKDKGVLDNLVIGIPGLTRNIKLLKGKPSSFDATKAAALNSLRTTATENSDPPDEEYSTVTSGGMLLLRGDKRYRIDQSLLLLTDNPDGSNNEAGAAVAVGDFDGDKRDDIAFGMPAYDNLAGAVAVLSGQKLQQALDASTANNGVYQAFTNADMVIPGLQAGERLGQYLSLSGSLNGDKANDLIIGNPEANGGSGRLHVIFGDVDLKGESNSEFTVEGMRIHELDRIDPERRLDIDSGTALTRLGSVFLVNNVNPEKGDGEQQSEKGRGYTDDLIIANSQSKTDVSVVWGKQKLKYTGRLSLKDMASNLGIQYESKTPIHNTQDLGYFGDINGDGYGDSLIGIDNDAGQSELTFALGSADDTQSDHPDAGVGGESTLSLVGKLLDTNPGIQASEWNIDQVSPASFKEKSAAKGLLVSVSNNSAGISQTETEEWIPSKMRLGLIHSGLELSSNSLFQQNGVIGWVNGVDDILLGNSIREGETLTAGQRLVSTNGSVQAVMAEDGTFKVYRNTDRGLELLMDVTSLSYYGGRNNATRYRVIPQVVPGSSIRVRNGYLEYVTPDGNTQILSSVSGPLHQPRANGVIDSGTRIEITKPQVNKISETALILSNSGAYSLRQGDTRLIQSYVPKWDDKLRTEALDTRELNRIQVIGGTTLSVKDSTLRLNGMLIALEGRSRKGSLGLIISDQLKTDVITEFRLFQQTIGKGTLRTAQNLSRESIDKLLSINVDKLNELSRAEKDPREFNNENLQFLAMYLDSQAAGLGATFLQYLSDKYGQYTLFKLLLVDTRTNQAIDISDDKLNLVDVNGDGRAELYISESGGELRRAELVLDTVNDGKQVTIVPNLTAEVVTPSRTSGGTISLPQDVRTNNLPSEELTWVAKSMWLQGLVSPWRNYETQKKIDRLPFGLTKEKYYYPYLYSPEDNRYTVFSGDYQTPIFAFDAQQTDTSTDMGYGGPKLGDFRTFTRGEDGTWQQEVGNPYNDKISPFIAPKRYTPEPDRFVALTPSNGQFLDQALIHLAKPYVPGMGSTKEIAIGGKETSDYISQGKSWELKIPSLIYSKKSIGSREGYFFSLHLGSDQRMNLSDSSLSTQGSAPLAGLDGFGLFYDQGHGTLQVYWNGKIVWQLGSGMSAKDKELVTLGREQAFTDGSNPTKPFDWLEKWLRNPDYLPSTSDASSGNLWNMAIYARYQEKSPGSQSGHLILQIADSTMARYRTTGKSVRDRIVPIMGIDVAIPVDSPLAFQQPMAELRVGGSNGLANQEKYDLGGIQAIKAVQFNTSQPIEGAGLDNMTSAGDLNGDGFEDFVGVGTLRVGWNYDYGSSETARDLARHNIKAESDGLWDNELYSQTGSFESLRGNGIHLNDQNSVFILWGRENGISVETSTPVFMESFADTDIESLHMAAAGDVNLDGYDDLLISNSDSSSGSTFILYGSPGLDSHRTEIPNADKFYLTTKANSLSVNRERAKKGYTYKFTKDEEWLLEDKSRSNEWNKDKLSPKQLLQTGFRADQLSMQGVNLAEAIENLNDFDPGTDKLPYYGGVLATEISGLYSGRQDDKRPDSKDIILSGLNLSGGGDSNGDGFNDFFVSSIKPHQLDQNTDSTAAVEFPSFTVFGTDAASSVSHLGTIGQDSLVGSPFNDSMVGREGNDILKGHGGADALFGGSGDDVVIINDLNLIKVDGGNGYDQLVLQGKRDGAWNLTQLAHRIRGFESLSIEDYGYNQATINDAAIERLASEVGSLRIIGDSKSQKPLQSLVESLQQYKDKNNAYQGQKRPGDQWLSKLSDQIGEQVPGYGDLMWAYVGIKDTLISSIKDDFINKRLDWDIISTSLITKAFEQFTKTNELLFIPELDHLSGSIATWLNSSLLPSLRDFLQEYRFEQVPSNSPLNNSHWINDFFDIDVNEYYAQWRPQFSCVENLIADLPSQFDSIILSTEFNMLQSGAPSSSERMSHYVSDSGYRIEIPDSILVIVDPGVPTALKPKPLNHDSLDISSNQSHSISTEASLSTTTNTNRAKSLGKTTSTGLEPTIHIGKLRRSPDSKEAFIDLTRLTGIQNKVSVVFDTGKDDNRLVSRTYGEVVFEPGEIRKRIPMQIKPESLNRNDYLYEVFDIDIKVISADVSSVTEINQHLRGRLASDLLKGGSRRDHINGRGGNDRINGGSGDDFIVGGAGSDQLKGGPGSDQFIFKKSTDSNAHPHFDTITGIKINDAYRDRFDIRPIGMLSTALSESRASSIRAADTVAELNSLFNSTAGTASARFTGDGNATALLASNVDGSMQLVIDTDGNGIYTADDIMVELIKPDIGAFSASVFI